MQTNRIYPLRRAMLRTFQRAEGVPLCANDLKQDEIQFLELDLRKSSLEEVQNQFALLKQHGYIAPIEGYNGEYCKLTEKGAQQLAIEFKKEPFIWGPQAL